MIKRLVATFVGLLVVGGDEEAAAAAAAAGLTVLLGVLFVLCTGDGLVVTI